MALRRAVTRLCWAALALAPALWVGWHVVENGVDVPFWDEWQFLPLLSAAQAGELPLEKLLASHNGHRIVLPRLLMLALALPSGWDVRWTLYASLGIALLALGLVARIAHSGLGQLQPGLAPPVTVAGAFLLFGLNAWENWACGWQVQIHLCVLFALLTACLAIQSRGRWRDAWGLSAAAGAGALSFGAGVILPPLAALTLWLQPGRDWRQRLAVSSVPLAVGLGVGWLHWGSAADRASSTGAGGLSAIDVAALTSAFLGAGFADGSAGAAVAIGALALVAWIGLALVLGRTGEGGRRLLMPVVVLVGFGVGSALLVTLARGAAGAHAVIAPRYATPAALMWLGLVLTGAGAATRGGASHVRGDWKLLVTGAALGVLLVGYVRTSAVGLGQLRAHRERLEHGRQLLHLPDPPAGSLGILFLDEEVRRWRGTLQALRLSTFRHAAQAPPLLPAPIPAQRVTGAIEAVEADPHFPGCLIVRGWAVDPFSEREVEAVALTADGEVVQTIERLGLRDDVRSALRRPLGFRSGWQAHLGARSGTLGALGLLADGRVVELRGGCALPGEAAR